MIKQLILAAVFCIAQGKEYQFVNNAGGPIWVGCQGNSDKPPLNNGGWIMPQGARISVFSPPLWAGRFWARTWCSDKGCETGDCGGVECQGRGGRPPVTLVEITEEGAGGLDFYDISLVDGFNLKASIEPLGGTSDGSQYSCKESKCYYDINPECPNELRLTGSSGDVIACKSACEAFHTDEYCCAGAHNTPETCRSESWPQDYPKFFKDRCPDAYSYAYDDHKSTFTCKAPAYLVTFA